MDKNNATEPLIIFIIIEYLGFPIADESVAINKLWPDNKNIRA